jgi:hypothetical protein
MGVSQGFFSSGSKVLIMKLKKADNVVKRFRLVFCLLPSVMRVRKGRISSWVIELMSLCPNSDWNLKRMNW